MAAPDDRPLPAQEQSFDHAVGTKQDRWRDGEIEHPSGVQIDDQLELRRLLDRQIARLRAIEDLVDVFGCAPA